MKIGLLDVDGHGYPNLATMKLSTYHKKLGDEVERWKPTETYDLVYESRVFSDTYSEDIEVTNADKVIKGGTGYAIHTVHGVELFDESMHSALSDEVDACKPDYSIYPELDFAVSMTTRGCPNNCSWCIVPHKEGCLCKQVASAEDFYNGQNEIRVLDSNLTALSNPERLLQEYRETGAKVDFTGGLDVRRLTGPVVEELNRMRIGRVRLAWDDASVDLEPYFVNFKRDFRRHACPATVYVLTNYGVITEEQDVQNALLRVYILSGLGYDPYIMIYNKPSAPLSIRRMQRWVNNKVLFRTNPVFEEIHWKEGTTRILGEDGTTY